MALTPEGINAAREFFTSLLWREIKAHLDRQKPSPPSLREDALTTASAFRRREGWEAWESALNGALGIGEVAVPLKSDGTPDEEAVRRATAGDGPSDATPFIDVAKD